MLGWIASLLGGKKYWIFTPDVAYGSYFGGFVDVVEQGREMAVVPVTLAEAQARAERGESASVVWGVEPSSKTYTEGEARQIVALAQAFATPQKPAPSMQIEEA